MPAPPMTSTWITVFHGPFTKALALQALLEARGIPTRVPDETTKVMDPFITGANPLAVQLCVPEADLDAARELLAEAAPAAPGRPDDADAAALRLARRLRWCLVLPPFGWIVGAWLGVAYLRAVRSAVAPPSGHARTVALWLLQVGLLAVLAASWALLPGLTPAPAA